MVRLHFVVEGQTEEEFVNAVLAPHLLASGIVSDARCVYTKRRGGIRLARGGVTTFAKMQQDLNLWIREDSNFDSYFTSLFDFYALPDDFPGRAEATGPAGQRVQALEEKWRQRVAYPRFIPHLQLHEFEALLLTDPFSLEIEFIAKQEAITTLAAEVASFHSPEDIDDGPETAPSKRIIRHLPGYAGRKSSAGPRVAERIGIPAIRRKCPHFQRWLTQLEGLKTE